jgi:hypothetical protein
MGPRLQEFLMISAKTHLGHCTLASLGITSQFHFAWKSAQIFNKIAVAEISKVAKTTIVYF